MLFTERYNDFSLPGGGVDEDEDIDDALKRELEKETGARNVEVKSHYGSIEEYRPHWKPDYDLMHMTSHFLSAMLPLNLRMCRWRATRSPMA